MVQGRAALVVEDDAAVLDLVCVLLGQTGWRVDVASGGREGLARVRARRYDLIVSDVRMPGMTGLELLRHLKERDPEIQLVLMSAYSSVTDAVEAIQLGAADYVEKPIDFRRL